MEATSMGMQEARKELVKALRERHPAWPMTKIEWAAEKIEMN